MLLGNFNLMATLHLQHCIQQRQFLFVCILLRTMVRSKDRLFNIDLFSMYSFATCVCLPLQIFAELFPKVVLSGFSSLLDQFFIIRPMGVMFQVSRASQLLFQ
jgi:hypothetical protein